LNIWRRGKSPRSIPPRDPVGGEAVTPGEDDVEELGSLTDTAARGVAWNALRAVSTRLITAAVFVVLARKLDPADFGIVALAMVFIVLISVLVESGFAEAIIQRKKVTQTDLNSAFWLNNAVSLALAVALFASADILSKTLGQPQLAPVLRVLSLVFVFSALASVPQAILRRGLAFRAVALRHLGGTLAGGAVGVAMALAGAGVWSLVGQLVATAGVGTAILWGMSRWRPGGHVSAASIKGLLSFSGNILGGRLAVFATGRSDDFLIGVVLGPVALGLYTVAYKILLILTETIIWTLGEVTFPVLSRLGSDPERRRRAFIGLTGLCAVVAVPTFLGLAVTAPELILVVFGPRWADAIPVAQTLPLVGIAHSAVSCNKAALNAVGRPDLTLRIGLLTGVVNVIGFAVTVHWGILAVAMSYVVCSYLLAPVSIWLATRVLSVGATSYLRLFAGPVASGLVMVVCVLGTKAALEEETGNLVRLLVSILVASTTYVAMLYLTVRRQVVDLMSRARRLRRASI